MSFCLSLQDASTVTIDDEECEAYSPDTSGPSPPPSPDISKDFVSLSEGLANKYSPPINDGEDHDIDQLMSEIHERIVNQNYSELVDDQEDPFEILTAHVAETVTDDFVLTGEQESTDEDIGRTPLYTNSSKCLGAVVLLMCCFVVKFRMSDEALKYLISFIALLLPSDHKMFRTLYQFRSLLTKYIHAPDIEYFCSFCYTHVNKNATQCSNKYCLKDLRLSGATAYFVRHSLISQLQVMFNRESFCDKVRTHRFNHYKKKSPGVISDVYDGSIYKNLFNKGFLNDPNSLSFGFNTDGVPIFKSSKVSMWPVYLLINELPILDRKVRENVVFYGVWIAPKKPVMWSFLKPLYDDISKLENGVDLVDHSGSKFVCKATLLTCTCDLPARCLISNSVQFNGKFSCWFCLQKGETYHTPTGGHCHIFPYQSENPKGPPRTVSEIEADVNKTVENLQDGNKDYVVRGIKGPFWFMFLKHFNITNGFVIDYMHGVCSGVMKMMLGLWFGKANKGNPSSYFKCRNMVNEYLLKIKPTVFITRVPRSLDDIVHWKASEYRNFLLYWGVPILTSVLSNCHILHFCALVKAIHILSQENIQEADLLVAENCLFNFVSLFPSLYSQRNMTMNLHQLVHLTDCVRATGPLFSNNCFVFEDLNGFIVRHIHGTQGIDTQIINSINIVQAIPILREKYTNDPEILNFYNDFQPQHHNMGQQIETGIVNVGTIVNKTLSNAETSCILGFYTLVSNIVVSFSKIFILPLSSYIYAQSYKRVIKRNQSVIQYCDRLDNQVCFGSVKEFIQFTDTGNCTRNVALVVPFDCNYKRDDKIHRVFPKNEVLKVVPLTTILKVCVFVEVDGNSYVCEIPNRYDRD